MFKNQGILVFFSVLFLFPLASTSEAIQWDLLIQANVENSPLYSGDRPIVSGVILDHASKPVHKATVNIKSGTMSIFTTTSQSGEFMAELGKHDRIPGNHIVNISAASQDGKTGIASIQFQVKGELAVTTVNQEKLSTPEAKKFLAASPEDFDKNPIGFMLYNYYQKVYQEYLEDEKLSEKLALEQAIIEEQKETERENRLKAIEKFQPGMGIFSGPQYENYVNSLDEEVRDTVVKHLNFTKNLVREAQDLRNKIIENGGTAEEAQIAYLEKITVTRNTIENFDNNLNKNDNVTDNKITNEALHQDTVEQINDIKLQDEITNSPLHADIVEQTVGENLSIESPIQVVVDGVNVEVNYEESIFYINVNGTELKFFVNGTEITLVNDSK